MIVVDVETTGLDCKKNSIIEIGALDLFNPENRFFVDCQAKPNSEVSDIALIINGHTREDIYLSSKPSQKEAIKSFDDWLKNIPEITLIGENPKFDLDFITQAYHESEMDSPLGYRTVDLHSITIGNLFQREKVEVPVKDKRLAVNSLFITNYVGIPQEPNPHNGLNGAIYEAEAFSRLVFGANLLKEFKDYPVPEYLKR
jgi:DNA polymerase III epsilon subunit-like protein